MIDLVNQSNRGDVTATSRPSELKDNLKTEKGATISGHRLYREALHIYQDFANP